MVSVSVDPNVIADYLSDRENAVNPCQFSWEAEVGQRPGLYTWWVDGEGREMLEGSLGEPIPSLIYAGQAGATSSRARKPSTATLGSRIRGNHLNGTAYGSTFRKTLSSLLLGPLGLTVEKPDRLTSADRQRVSKWMCDHLSIVLYPFDDKDALGEIEDQVLSILDPPLNISGVAPTSVRRQVSDLRRSLTRPEIGVRPSSSDSSVSGGGVRFMIPTGGPEGWKSLLADPDLHWVQGRSARTLAHAWEDANGWPAEVAEILKSDPNLSRFRPTFAFPEYETPLPGGRRPTQTDLLVLAADGRASMTMAVEGKVDESFGPLVSEWSVDASEGKRERLSFLAERQGLDAHSLSDVRYQLLHRCGAAKIESARNGSEVAAMVVHSWAPASEGFDDYAAFCELIGVEPGVGRIGYSASADLWVGWAAGDPRYLVY